MPYVSYPNILELKQGEFENIQTAFEFLSKELLEAEEYGFKEPFIIKKMYPGVEASAIEDSNGKYHSFQCKFSKSNLIEQLCESFFGQNFTLKELKSKNNLKCKIIEKQLNYLHIFMSGNISDNGKNAIEEKLKIFFPSITIIWRYGELINEKLKKRQNISKKYFPHDKILASIHEENKNIAESRGKDVVNKIIDQNEKVDNENFGFTGKFGVIDVNIAQECYNEYILNKYAFFDTPSFDSFGEIESYIEKDKFRDLERHTKCNQPNLKQTLDYFTNELSKIPNQRLEKISLDYLIEGSQQRQGLLINEGVHNKCEFNFNSKGQILFISKLNNGGK